MIRAAAALLLSLSLLPTLAGCGKESPAQPVARVPRDLSATGVVRAFETAWNERNLMLLDSLLTEDFLFAHAESVSATLPTVWLREGELRLSRAMWLGEGPVLPLSAIDLALDKNLIPFPDTRPGKLGKVHKTMRSGFSLALEDPELGQKDCLGFVMFYVVRGESAVIPPGHGAPDSTRWWIQGIVDETIFNDTPPGGPSKTMRFGELRRVYRDRLIAAGLW